MCMCFEQALAIQRNSRGGKSAETAQTLYNLGTTLLNLEQHRAATLSKRIGINPARVAWKKDSKTISAMIAVATCYFSLGDYTSARSLYERLIVLLQKAGKRTRRKW